MAARLLEPDVHPVPGCLLRQRVALARHLPRARLGDAERGGQGEFRRTCLAPVRRSIPPVRHGRRLDGGSLQQALGDDRREGRGNRHHALRRLRPQAGEAVAPARRDLPDGRAQHDLRPGEIRRHARGAADLETVLRKWNPRAAHLHRHHPRHLRRRLAGRGTRASRDGVRTFVSRIGRGRIDHQHRHRQSPRRGSSEEIQP